MRLPLPALGIVLGAVPVCGFYPKDFSQPLETIAFGSCNKETAPQDYWKTVTSVDPDVWIWLGDNVYLDQSDLGMQATWDLQKENPHYTAFRQHHPIVGTWDDHDYGVNNGGRSYSQKAETQRLLLDFLDEPKASARRDQEGVYTSYTFGPPEKSVKLILLDNRYFRAEEPSESADFFGEDQWQFLEKELTDSSARIHLIAQGGQWLPTDHRFERLSKYTKEMERFLKLLRKTKAPGVILLSGDRHHHEISVRNDEKTPYPLYDLTSSSLNAGHRNSPEFNRYRVDELYLGNAFACIEIDWTAEPVLIQLKLRDAQSGDTVASVPVALNNLQARKDARK